MSTAATPIAVSRAMRAVGDRLTTWRKLRQLTVVDVADRAGIGVSTVHRLEAGQGASLVNVLRVSRALGVLDAVDTALDPFTTDVGRFTGRPGTAHSRPELARHVTGSTRARRETAPIRPVEVVVHIGKDDVLAGTLYAHRRRGTESATFSYTAEYLRAPQAYPLDPTLPLVTGAQQNPDRAGDVRGVHRTRSPDPHTASPFCPYSWTCVDEQRLIA